MSNSLIKITVAHNDSLIGHNKLKDDLINLFNKDKLAHASIFAGPAGIGKASLVYQLIHHILTLNRSDIEKQHIIGRINNNTHGDFLNISHAHMEKEISVEEIRKIGNFLSLTPTESPYRIIMIDSIDTLSSNAANAMLKILEEPPENSFIFLICHSQSRLLPTIRSRASLFKVSLSNIEANNILKINEPNIDEETAAILLSISENSPGLAILLYQHKALDLYKELLLLVNNASNNDIEIEKITKFATNFAGKNDDSWYIFIVLVNYLVTKIVKSMSCSKFEPEIIEGENEVIKKLKEQSTIESCFELWDKIQFLLYEKMRSNLDHQQVILSILEKLTLHE